MTHNYSKLKKAGHILSTWSALIILLLTSLISLNASGNRQRLLPQNSNQQNSYYQSSRQTQKPSIPLPTVCMEEEQEEENEESGVKDVQLILATITNAQRASTPATETHSLASIKKKKEIQFYFSGSSPPKYHV